MENYLEGLNKQQHEAVTKINGPVCVIAGAGSGKTSVLTKRIFYLIQNNISPFNILAITFTNKAAKEMKERVNTLVGKNAVNVEISTFHSFCNKILRQEIEYVPNLKKRFTILDEDEQKALAKTCLLELNIDVEKISPANVIGYISSNKNDLVLPQDVNITNFWEKKMLEVYELYQKKLQKNNCCDFDDLILKTVLLFKNNKYILEKYQNRFKYISIDEYQDTNKAQYELTNILANKYKNIFVVGDVDQCIYGFRKADYTNILNFERDYPNAIKIKLEQNYRSYPCILEAANAVIKNNKEREEKVLWTNKNNNSLITINEHQTSDEEVTEIVDKIKENVNKNNYKYKDIAILLRINAQTRIFEEFFMKNGIPYKLIGALNFYDRKEIKDILAYLKFVSNPNDLLSLSRIINVPKRGIGEKSYSSIVTYCEEQNVSFLEGIKLLGENLNKIVSKKASESLKSFCKWIEELYEKIESEDVGVIMEEILTKSQYLEELIKKGGNDDRVENVMEFLSVAKDFSRKRTNNLTEDFIDYLALLSGTDELDEKEDSVTIMTIHASKGLEFPIVFIVSVEENIFPHWRAIKQEVEEECIKGIEEERRLMYVAITRAKEKLYMSYAYERTMYGKVIFNTKSRFIDEIPEQLVAFHNVQETKDNFLNEYYKYKKGF